MHIAEIDPTELNDLLNTMDGSPKNIAELIAKLEGELVQAATHLATATLLTALPLAHGLTIPINIRMPADVLAIYKAEAVKQGVGYQTLMIKTLQEQSALITLASKTSGV